MADQMTRTGPIETTPITATRPEAASTVTSVHATASTEITSADTSAPRAGPVCACGSGRGSRVAQLAAAAEEAAQVRALTTRPDVVALRVDRVRAQVDALLWAGIVLGLLFTTVNVQQFAAAGAAMFSSGWWMAWLLDPMVSLVLLAVLRAEQVTARYQVPLGVWPRRVKWCAFGVTYLMNTWSSWGLSGEALSVSGVVLHSVPPLLVVLSAETGPVLRDRLTEAARRALTDHCTGREGQPTGGPSNVVEATVNGPTAMGGAVRASPARAVHEPASKRGEPQVREPTVRERHPNTGSDSAAGQRRSSRRSRRHPPVPRRLLADYLTVARAALADAAVSGQRPDPTPAWCRRTTGCSAGTSVKLAAALRAAAVQPADAPAARSVPEPAGIEGAPLSVDHVDSEVPV